MVRIFIDDARRGFTHWAGAARWSGGAAGGGLSFCCKTLCENTARYGNRYVNPYHVHSSARRYRCPAAACWLHAIAYAAHPLISDDSGTQGAGNWQLEVNTDHTRTRDDGQTAWARQLNTTLTRGVTDELDVAANLPLQRNSASGEPAQSGVADVTVQAKWRF